MIGQPAKSQPTTCPHCKEDVEQKPGVGRRKLYCTPDAGKLHRQRLRALGMPV